MFQIAGELGVRIGDIERWPMSELLEWAEYEKIRATKPEQTADSMMRNAQFITARMKGKSRG